ncbi:MAG: alpha/beta hydrolase [Burkholderiaceae bacterium]
MKIEANGISIEVEDSGGSGPAVLLIMGLGMQLVAWPQGFVQGLVDAGYRVIRHDNRDVGLSHHFNELGVPNLVWAMTQARFGFTPRAPYQLADMAHDAIGVLDALSIDCAHVLGVSMGGMIAQRIALAAPRRVLSLTSIMSSSGARGLPNPRPDVLRALMRKPKDNTPAAQLAHSMALFRLIGSPGFATTDAELKTGVLAAAARGVNRAGVARQLLAIGADTQRAAELRCIKVPALVLHGKADPLVPFACGADTARRIPDARLVAIDGMGHDLAPGLLPLLLEPLLAHLAAVPTSQHKAEAA